jgi:hypothetical protein
LEAIMEPATLAATAIAAALPYLLTLGKEGVKGAASEAGKSIWEWVKRKLISPAGQEAVRDLEGDPNNSINRQAIEIALSKLLHKDESATQELRSMLAQVDAMSVQGDVSVNATHGGIAVGGSMIGSTATTGVSKPKA